MGDPVPDDPIADTPNNGGGDGALGANGLPPGDPDIYLKYILDRTIDYYNHYNLVSTRFVRHLAMFSTYTNNVPFSGSNSWHTLYQSKQNLDYIRRFDSTDIYDIPYYRGTAQVMQAYQFMTAVDFHGDIPYTEATDVNSSYSAGLDDGSFIYDAQIAALDSAKINFEKSSAEIPLQIYNSKNFNKQEWIAFANTLQLKAFLNLRLVDPARATAGITRLLNEDLIDQPNEDFYYKYDFGPFPLDEHLWYYLNYSGGGATFYLSNNMLDYLNAGDANPPFIEEGIADPRLRYYTYRQTENPPSGSNLPCAGDPVYDYCYVGNLYWGRDHADDEGLPNDGTRRSTLGVYPIGGAFDNDAFEQARMSDNTLSGGGILPIALSSFTHFMLAEASLTLGTPGSPNEYLETAIRQSMQKVLGFSDGLNTVSPNSGINLEASQADVDAYVARVLAEFNDAGAQEKLAVVAREYFLAAFGNGIEIYNLYRRTGMPDLQAPVFGKEPFPRSIPYPVDWVSLNPNLEFKPTTTQVFWDNNPAGFID
jgi:hypothetical protein